MVKIELYLNGAFITTAAPDYAALRAERNITADTLLINGHHRGWQTALADGDHALMFNAAQTPSPALWQAIYQARYGKEVMRRLQIGQVAICGLGGLGSLVAIELARLGVGRLLLIDGDTVEPTNLARQHYTISQIGQLKTQALATTLANFAPLTQVEQHSTAAYRLAAYMRMFRSSGKQSIAYANHPHRLTKCYACWQQWHGWLCQRQRHHKSAGFATFLYGWRQRK